MEKDKEKMLIPCYRDIDPYDMPQEFKNLQGQDMGKLGFLQDLVRGREKIIAPEQNKAAVAEILDQATFAKGYDDEFSKACMDYEASGVVSDNVISRIKKEFGITIMK
jgi:hypothetical protein